MTSGEFIVVGTNKVDIKLLKKPTSIAVRFIDEQKHVPCNPHHDDLGWTVHKDAEHHHKHIFHYTLRIHWNVSHIRKIAWHVEY